MKIENTIQNNTKSSPVLLDRVLQDIQSILLAKLPWLNYAFGRAYKLISFINKESTKFVYPAIYNGSGEYISVLPNDNLGNFSWFDIYDPQEITQITPGLPQISFKGALVFWYKLDTIYADNSVLYTEEIKSNIMRVLTTPGLIKTIGRLNVLRIYERFENIYADYSLEKLYDTHSYKNENLPAIDKQFFMYPYAGLRIEFSITTRELCYTSA